MHATGRCVATQIASIGPPADRPSPKNAIGPEGFSLLEMTLVVTRILTVVSIATPDEAVSSQPSAFSEPAES
jgi:hypothetical protein